MASPFHNNGLHALHVYRTYFPDPPGGLQEAIRQICLATKLQGVENKIFTLSPNCSPSEIVRPEGVVVRGKSWATPASCDIGDAVSFQLFAEATAWADVIHYHFPWPFADVLNLTLRPSCPKVMTYHSDIVRQRLLGKLYAPLMYRMLASMTAIVATSPHYATTSPVLASASVNRKVRFIPLGIVEESYLVPEDTEIFSKLQLNPSEPYFLFIGVLRYYKGLHHLINAAGQVNASIVIAGSGPEEHFLQSIHRNETSTNVIIAGQISNEEKAALLKHSLALVLPSHLRSEAFGMVLVEAALYSRPLISCEIGTGTSFVNMHQETGLVVPPNNAKALAEAMNTLLHAPSLATSLGSGARRRYEQLFSGKALGTAYTELYKEVAQCKC